MLKRMVGLLAVLAAWLLLCVNAQAAARPETGTFEDFRFVEKEGFTTVITDLRGNQSTFGGVLQVTSLEQHEAVTNMAAYAVCYGEDVILSVQLHDILPQLKRGNSGGVAGKPAINGYYSVELPLGNDLTAFLTGLTPEYLTELQSASLDAILSESELSLEDIGFIDAEKQYWVYDDRGTLIDTDEEMCWAASMANILHYTGWAKKAGFASTDYMYDELVSEFSDFGGSTDYGLQWFFNGVYPAQTFLDWAADETDYGTFRGYLPDYCAQSLVQSLDLRESPERMAVVLEGLREGCGAELDISWMENWTRTSGHSVSLWGMVYSTGADLREKDSWYALVISDSDNSVTFGENRRTAPNTLTLCRITPTCGAGYDSWYFDRNHAEWANGTASDGMVSGATLLRPYSDALEKDGGTGDATAYPDWIIDDLWTMDLDDINFTPYLAADSGIFLGFAVRNQSHASGSADVAYEVRVSKRGDESFCEVFSGTVSAEVLTDGYEAAYVNDFEGLAPGVYDVEAGVTSGEAEAYLSNNTLKKTFYVSERSREQDDLTFEAKAFYDGPPVSGYYGNGGIGRLALSYSGSIGYSAAHYSVEIQYATGEYQSLYWGKERPETVYGLQPLGSTATVWVYVTPEDPSEGYERYLGSAEVELTYYHIQMEAEAPSLSPIYDTDYWLPYGEQITLTFRESASFQEDDSCYFRIYAVNKSSSYPITEGWISSEDYREDGSQEYPIYGFFLFDYDLGDWQGITLPAGDYSLWAYVYYDVSSDGYYTYCDNAYCGELTVLPAGIGLKNISHNVLSPTETEISYTISAAPCDSLILLLCFGTDPEQLNELFIDYGAWDGGEFTDSIIQTTEPQTTYYYCMALCIDDNASIVYEDPERYTFVTPAGTGIEPPPEAPLPTIALLEPGVTSLGLTGGGEVFYETFTPEEDGVWSFTFAGPDGYFRVWDEAEGAWSAPVYFTLGGKTLETEVSEGRPVLVYLFAYVKGDYEICCEPDGQSYHLGEGEIKLCVSTEAGENCFAAAYSADGQMLSAQTAAEAGWHVFSFNDDSLAWVRIFRLNPTTFAPLSERTEKSVTYP